MSASDELFNADDFSDSEPYTGDYSDGRHDEEKFAREELDQDEQQAQKVNGRIEALEMRVEEITKELESEKASHRKTRDSLQEANEFINKKSEDSARATVVSNYFRKYFIDYCLKNSIPDFSGYEEFTDAELCGALDYLANKLDFLKREESKSSLEQRPRQAASATENTGKSMESGFREMITYSEDLNALKNKIVSLTGKLRTEKEGRLKAEDDIVNCHKKIEILGHHLEKLMISLKQEAASKIRTVGQLRASDNNVNQMKLINEVFQRKILVKDRLISELREGSKILEDQLRLMDEKYLDLRSKLDWARQNGQRKIERAVKEAADLRTKLVMQKGTGSIRSGVSLPGLSQSIDSDGNVVIFNSSGASSKSRQHPQITFADLETKKPVDINAVAKRIFKRQERIDKSTKTKWTEDKVRKLLNSK